METTYKYSEEARFCFGVAIVRYKHFKPAVGKRCKLINYTGKKIVSQSEYMKKIKDEIKYVKS